jgi:hypothetical protein
VVEKSEGFFEIREGDHSTPVVMRGVASGKQLTTKVVEKSVKANPVKASMASKAEDNIRDDTQMSDADDEDVKISRTKLKGFTQALTGADQTLNVIVRKFKLDKDKDEEIKEIGNLIT